MSNQINKLELVKEELDKLNKAFLDLNQKSQALLQACLSNNTSLNTIKDEIKVLKEERDKLEETKRLLKDKLINKN